MWTQCNETMRGHDEKSRNDSRRDSTEIILREICSRRDFMQPSDRDLILLADIDRHLQRSTIMNWISVHQPLIIHSIKETDNEQYGEVGSIRIILLADIDRHLQRSTIMSWISVHRPLIIHSIKETDNEQYGEVGSIRTYFPAQQS